MKKIKKFESMVFEILYNIPITRSDDYLLYYLVVDEHFKNNPHLGDIEKITFAEIMHGHIAMNIPSYETITRCRRKVQEKHPELRSKTTERKRHKKEKAFRAYAYDVAERNYIN